MSEKPEKLELIAEKFAKCNGIPKSEAVSMLDSITIGVESLREAFRPLVKEAVKAWNDIKGLIKSILKRKNEKSYDNQENWIINWDTRKKSLVISNRPQHMVRKIIR